MSNDQQRAVTTHIGVLAEAFDRRAGRRRENGAWTTNAARTGARIAKRTSGEAKKPPTQRQVSFSVGNVPSLARPWELPPAED